MNIPYIDFTCLFSEQLFFFNWVEPKKAEPPHPAERSSPGSALPQINTLKKAQNFFYV